MALFYLVVWVFGGGAKSRKPAVLDVRIDSDEKVFPMCPPGADLKEVFDETDL